jgi:CoA:oxalate CoA-transferase
MEPHLPLDGVRVIDLTTFLSGPMATHTLGELGADVIKIEPPGGDPTRAGTGLAPGDAPSPFWMALHRDRRSVVLDLKQPAGLAALRDLVAGADVLVENFRPGVTARLGITDADLRPINPMLVYCSLTGYGPDGVAADQPATDGPIQAFSGALELTGAPVPLTVGDLSGAAHAVQGIVAALYARERNGRGCHLELSLAECLLQWLAVTDRGGTLAPPTTLVLSTSDGLRLLIQTPMHMRTRFLALVGEVTGSEAFAADPRWATVAGQRAALDEYLAGSARAIAARTAAAWLAALGAAGIPAATVRTIDEAMGDSHLAQRGATAEVDVPGLGPVRLVRSPFVIDGHRRQPTALPPTLGEHTESVLRDVLGYDDERLAEARAAGALGR